MVVMVMENVAESLRGELTRWLLEVKAGVFVGTVNNTVRNILWKKVTEKADEGGAMLIYSMNTEQGFEIKSHGNLRRTVNDFDGITLITNKLVSNSINERKMNN